MDHWKAFVILNHRLLLAKLKAYGRKPVPLKLMQNYLTGRYQSTKINNDYSSWSGIIAGVSQGLLLSNFF